MKFKQHTVQSLHALMQILIIKEIVQMCAPGSCIWYTVLSTQFFCKHKTILKMNFIILKFEVHILGHRKI